MLARWKTGLEGTASGGPHGLDREWNERGGWRTGWCPGLGIFTRKCLGFRTQSGSIPARRCLYAVRFVGWVPVQAALPASKRPGGSPKPCPAPSHAARRQPGVLGFESAQIDVEDWLRLVVEPMGDYAGSCRMGQPGDPTAVVDGSGRVFGVRGLRVADSSIAPTLVRAAPMLTDVVIGSWISQLINAGISAPGVGKSSH